MLIQALLSFFIDWKFGKLSYTATPPKKKQKRKRENRAVESDGVEKPAEVEEEKIRFVESC